MAICLLREMINRRRTMIVPVYTSVNYRADKKNTDVEL